LSKAARLGLLGLDDHSREEPNPIHHVTLVSH
jgi:hypothetical protein